MSTLPALLRSPRGAAAVVVAVVVTLLVVVGQVAEIGDATEGPVALTAAIAGSFTVLGGLVLVSIPGHLVGRLMTAAGLTATVALLAASWTGWTPLAWLAQWSWWPCFGLIFLSLLVFPDGRLPTRRWRALAVLIVAATVLGSLALAAAALDEPRALLFDITVPLSSRAQALVNVAAGAAVVALLGYLGVLCSLWLRWRRADDDTRRQLVCLLPAAVVFLLGLLLDTLGLSGAWVVTAVAVPLGMTIAVLRYRLYDLDLVVNRSIVWLVMTLLVVAGFVAIVWILRDALFDVATPDASLVATGVIAVTFEPLHRRVQRAVDHLLYGDRDDPYLVIARLGEVLGCTVEPTAVLPILTGTIARSLQVPYVAVELQERDGPVLHAEHGRLATSTESFDMVSHGRSVGRLLVARRSPSAHFSRRECRLLQDLARQAAVAAEATRLTRDLQASRERLITTREEERRRLRRDLHDGLGPSLAGMSMEVRAVRRLVGADTRAAGILDALTADLRACTLEVRQLVDELRPPALDRGLEPALRAECQRFSDATLTVHCDLDGGLEGLPAAVEVAAYRIVSEALTNVVRHSRARTCRVLVRRHTALTVEVVDDGVGISASAPIGVGLTSIRERADELGGSCLITAAPGGGVRISIELPLELAQRRTEET